MKRTFRGQGTNAKGELHITLSGPAGCGKSLVAKIIAALLPLVGVDVVVLQTRQTK